MANKEIGDLTAASALTGSETVHVVQSTNSRRTTTQDIADLASGDLVASNNLSDVSNAATALSNLGGEPADADILKADVSDALTVGYTATPHALGTVTTGTTTPDPANNNFQTMTNGGASTIAAPTATGSYSIVIQITNNASAGALTLSGFTNTSGADFTTTDGDDFFLFITKVGSFTSAYVEALQ